MTTPTRPPHVDRAPDPEADPTTTEPTAPVIGVDPDGGTGVVHDLLTAAVEEAARLLEADGAMVYLIDPATGRLRFAHDAGIRSQRSRRWVRSIDLPVGVGMFGRAVAERAVITTDDYLTDDAFPHADDTDRVVRDVGILSMVVAPLVAGETVFGAMGTFAARPSAFSPADVALVRALADHAAASMSNARLIEALDASRRELAERAEIEREALARRAEAERALREIAARITNMREPAKILQDVVKHAGRLVRANAVILDLLDATTGNLHWAFDDGLADLFTDEERAKFWISVGVGATGTAVAEGRVVVADDDLVSFFPPSPESTEFFRRTGFRSMIAAPIAAETGPLGVIEVYATEPGAFSETDAALVFALADQAAIAMTNARLIEELERSQAAVARRADTERALREITAGIAALREPQAILDRVVDEAMRLLGTDAAHLTRMSDDETYLVPVFVSGAKDPETQAWFLQMEFPLGGGINGLAAQLGEPVWTTDYATDPRIPHEPDDNEVAERLGLGGMAAAPLRAPGGEVIGTLAVSWALPRDFEPEELDLLQGLADQAAIAITNSTLLARLSESEERYRYLVENAPDVVLSIGPDTRLTFVSDAVERLTGVRPEALVGQHFGALVHESSSEVARFDWVAGRSPGAHELRGRVNMLALDGSPIPAEFIAVARVDEAGRFVGANGSVRDMRDRDRLERDLRDSEIRYRTLASSSPDLVFATDAEGRYTFLSDQARTMLGWDIEGGLGRHFMEYVAPGWEAAAGASFAEIVADPTEVHTARIEFLRGDGRPIPLEINVVGSMQDGRLSAIHGVARDVAERERLERELQESEARFRHLVQTSPDVIYRTDAEGRFLFMAEGAEALFGWSPAEIAGMSFAELTGEASLAESKANFEAQQTEHDVVRRFRYDVRYHDGTTFPAEITSVSVWEDGRFAGVQGTVRDISAVSRLERELRESEERYRYLVASSPDLVWLTDAQGTLTFISDAARTMLGIEPTELMGRPYAEIFAPSARRDATTRFRWLGRHPSAVHRMRLPFRHADGHDIMVEINGRGMTTDGRFSGAHGAARDVSERDRLERDLRRQAGELAAGEERAHLARELHDSVTQALFSMSLVSRSVELLLDRDVEAAKGQLAQLRDLQREALAEMRALIFELRPGNLEQDGLTRALRTHTAALQGRLGLPIVVESTLDERLPLPIEEVLYRISQEALHNVVKHAGARQVRLEVGRIASGVRLRIQDDGKGFDPTRVPDGHLGLAGMRARADKIDARFSVRSVPGEGTTIEVVVPGAAIGSSGPPPAETPPASIRDGD